MNELELSKAIEDVLVSRNVRNMQVAQAALEPGYYLRAASFLRGCSGNIIIGTGFPVADTFETDGPVGAIALYRVLEALGASPWLACAPPLSDAIAGDYRVLPLLASTLSAAEEEASKALQELSPEVVVSIERPGLTADGHYYNMRGENISPRCGIFDPFIDLATCPTIAIGDGGNEIGMGNIREAISDLDINASVTCADELLVADVSNWAAYGLLAFLERWHDRDFLGNVSHMEILDYLSARGSVDGVTRENTLTEDGLELEAGENLINELRRLVYPDGA
jgi:hypothetical protein